MGRKMNVATTRAPYGFGLTVFSKFSGLAPLKLCLTPIRFYDIDILYPKKKQLPMD